MDLPTGFVFGVLFGSLLLCLGLSLGIWLGRRSDAATADREQLQSLLTGLFRWTNGFASDVSHYREALDRVSREFDPDKVQAADGEIVGLLTQIVHANEELQDRLDNAETTLNDQAQEINAYMCEARTDTLTQLPNRRAFDDELSRRLAEWRRNGVPLSVVLVDIDHFKQFNDQYGHAAGDAVLSDVARVLRAATRESDMVARLGGEEFATILPGVEPEAACEAAERTRQAIETAVFCYESKSLSVTVSCGAAQASEGESAATLVKRADKALYASKAAGRNSSHYHDGLRCVPLTRAGKVRPVVTTTSGDPDQPAGDFADVCDKLRERLLEITEGET
jgi:diguanylate cyclase